MTATVRLTLLQRLSRAYGLWWDLINSGLAVLILVAAFLFVSLVLLSGHVELLPFGNGLWDQFMTTVPPNRQSEIGLSILGITISGGSAAAFYLIRVGTIRWATNRRVGQRHLFFAQELWRRTQSTSFRPKASKDAASAFLEGSKSGMEQVSETHADAQKWFERARMRSYLLLESDVDASANARLIALDLFCAAVLCLKCVVVFGADRVFENEIKSRVLIGPDQAE